MRIESRNPATDEIVATYDAWEPAQVDEAVERVATRQRVWAHTAFEARAVLIEISARLLRERAAELARLMAVEMGKPVAQGRAEAEKRAWACEYFARNAGRLLADEEVGTDAGRSYVRCEPLGVVLAVMPWNFPFWQVFRFAAPALMAGNAALLKHASNVTGCALAIERLLMDAGLPADLFRALARVGDKGNAHRAHGKESEEFPHFITSRQPVFADGLPRMTSHRGRKSCSTDPVPRRLANARGSARS